MSAKTKLGRNPFAKKSVKSGKSSGKSFGERKPQAAGGTKAQRVRVTMPSQVMASIRKAVRFVSIEAPLGLCYLTYRACLLSFAPRSKRAGGGRVGAH